MSGPTRIGLVGCGRLGETGYALALRRAGNAVLAALADPNEERRAAIDPRLPGFSSASGLLAAGLVDAVVLATPVQLHLADARLATAAGIPVLVEKPPAMDAREARELAALAPQPRVAFNRRFEPGLRRLRDRVPPTGEVMLSLTIHTQAWAWGAHVVRDDALLDLGPHLIDLATWLTRSPLVRLRATTLTPTAVVLELELEHGAASIDCATDQPYREHFELRAGRRVTTSRKGGLWRRATARLTPPDRRPFVRALTGQVEAFAAHVQGADPGELGSAEDGAAVMLAVDAARASAAQGGIWVDLA